MVYTGAPLLTVALSSTLMEKGSATLCFRRACSSSWRGRRSHFPNTTRSMSLWVGRGNYNTQCKRRNVLYNAQKVFLDHGHWGLPCRKIESCAEAAKYLDLRKIKMRAFNDRRKKKTCEYWRFTSAKKYSTNSTNSTCTWFTISGQWWFLQ